jgi:predicted RNA polymerase sigma factor
MGWTFPRPMQIEFRADDAMHEADAAAVEIWQRDGVPANPRAWLVSTGKFKAINALRRQGRLKALKPEIASRVDEVADENAARAATAIAKKSYEQAMELARQEPERRFLTRRLSEI